MHRTILRAATILLTTAILLAASGAQSAQAGVVRLLAAPGGLTSGACDTWASACDLQYALSVAGAPDEVWVKKGIYKPTTSTSDRNATFLIKSGLTVYGGFAGTETAAEERNWTTNRTILSGDIDNNDVNTDGNRVAEKWTNIKGGNSYNVVSMSGSTPVDLATVLNGFIITAGDSGLGHKGGGLWCNAVSQCSPTLSHLVFSGNRASSGGALYNNGSGGRVSSPLLKDVTFRGNYAEYSGGAIVNDGYMGTASPSLIDVTFVGNCALTYGGAIMNVGEEGGFSNPILRNVTFDGNFGDPNASSGGAMFNSGYGGMSNPELVNVTFRGNRAQFGGAMYNFGYGTDLNVGVSSPTLFNVTFTGNVATDQGGAIFNDGRDWTFSGDSVPFFANAILWGNVAGSGPEMYNADANPHINYSIVQGGDAGIAGDSGLTAWSIGSGNLAENPLLNAPKNNGGLTLTMTLRAGSPAINAGTNTGCPADDQRGLARPQEGTCDIGATEYPEPKMTLKSQATSDGWVLETGDDTGLGGTKNAGATKIRVGDESANQQYRGVLSFNTAGLPDTATITSVTLRVKEAGIVGTSPFSAGNLLVDCSTGTFGAAALEISDYEAAATHAGSVVITSDQVSGWHSGTLAALNFACINKLGITQFRLGFLDESTNGTADYMYLWSGNALASQRPQLIITYYVP